MTKSIRKKTNGNVFKTIVRGVVQEELVKSEARLTENLMDKIDEKFEKTFIKYKNETVNKLDGVIKELKRGYEELTAHTGRHDATEERLDKLEAIHPQGRHQ